MTSGPAKSLAAKWWEAMAVESAISDGIFERGCEDFDSIGGDDYDNSIEIYGAGVDVRLSAECVEWLLGEAGFSKIYLNHTDGWQTHYPAQRGYWRRRYVSDPTATTTNVIAGPPNPGYFEVSYMPDGFPAAWLESGYMRVVPDPLQPSQP